MVWKISMLNKELNQERVYCIKTYLFRRMLICYMNIQHKNIISVPLYRSDYNEMPVLVFSIIQYLM